MTSTLRITTDMSIASSAANVRMRPTLTARTICGELETWISSLTISAHDPHFPLPLLLAPAPYFSDQEYTPLLKIDPDLLLRRRPQTHFWL